MFFKKKDKDGKKREINNAAISSFKHKREKGFIRNRVLAALVDFIAIAFLCQLAFMIWGAPDWGRYLTTQDEVRDLPKEDQRVADRARLYNECFILSLAIGASYEAMFYVLFATTPGKQLFGLKLVPKNEDRKYWLNKLFYVGRAVLKGVSIYMLAAIPFIFLCLTTYGNADGRSGFDLFAGTKVISKPSGFFGRFARKPKETGE